MCNLSFVASINSLRVASVLNLLLPVLYKVDCAFWSKKSSLRIEFSRQLCPSFFMHCVILNSLSKVTCFDSSFLHAFHIYVVIFLSSSLGLNHLIRTVITSVNSSIYLRVCIVTWCIYIKNNNRVTLFFNFYTSNLFVYLLLLF